MQINYRLIGDLYTNGLKLSHLVYSRISDNSLAYQNSYPLILVILINRALKHNSKDCEFNLEINIKGFKIYFKTKEKNAPSSQD